MEEIKIFAEKIGYPVILKASGGGGGRGIRVVHKEQDLENAFESCKREALTYFNNDEVFMEKYVVNPRHIEFQILGDNYGNIIHLCERDCSIQRRHQKVIEIAPCPGISDNLRKTMGVTAVAAAKAVGYTNAGTIEFLLDDYNRFYFMEMNTRIQVEHPITEEITGIDLIVRQIRIAAGEICDFFPRIRFEWDRLQPPLLPTLGKKIRTLQEMQMSCPSFLASCANAKLNSEIKTYDEVNKNVKTRSASVYSPQAKINTTINSLHNQQVTITGNGTSNSLTIGSSGTLGSIGNTGKIIYAHANGSNTLTLANLTNNRTINGKIGIENNGNFTGTIAVNTFENTGQINGQIYMGIWGNNSGTLNIDKFDNSGTIIDNNKGVFLKERIPTYKPLITVVLLVQIRV